MTAVRAVLFDLDGVLIDSKEAWFHLVNATARHFGKAAIDASQFEASWGQGIDADLETFFRGCRESEVSAFYDAHLLDYADAIRVEPQARGLLEALETAGIARAVVTNTPTALAASLLEAVRLRDFFQVIVGARPTRRSKPAPDPVWEASRRVGVPIKECLFVGDSAYDREAALASRCPFLGLRMPGVDSIQHLGEVLERIDGT